MIFMEHGWASDLQLTLCQEWTWQAGDMVYHSDSNTVATSSKRKVLERILNRISQYIARIVDTTSLVTCKC